MWLSIAVLDDVGTGLYLCVPRGNKQGGRLPLWPACPDINVGYHRSGLYQKEGLVHVKCQILKNLNKDRGVLELNSLHPI